MRGFSGGSRHFCVVCYLIVLSKTFSNAVLSGQCVSVYLSVCICVCVCVCESVCVCVCVCCSTHNSVNSSPLSWCRELVGCVNVVGFDVIPVSRSHCHAVIFRYSPVWFRWYRYFRYCFITLWYSDTTIILPRLLVDDSTVNGNRRGSLRHILRLPSLLCSQIK